MFRSLITQLLVCLILMSLMPLSSFAQGLYVDLHPKTTADIKLILDTLEAGASEIRTDEPPIVVMLHGNEAHKFVRPNYGENKGLVDQAAKLAAYKLVDVKICETWMRAKGYTNDDLFPFVSTVPYGNSELERLATDESYSEYDVDL